MLKAKKKLELVVVSLLCIGMLAGCAGSSQSIKEQEPTAAQATAAQQETSQKPAEESDGKVTIITIANDRLEEQKAALLKAYPGEDFEMIGVPDTDIISKVQMDIMSGANTYDIISTGQGAVQLGVSGLVEELPMLADWDDILDGTKKNYMWGDKIYGYPVQSDTCLLYYRKDLLEKAGYSGPPKTYDEFREMARKLTTDVNGKHPGEAGFDEKNIEVYGAIYHGGNFNSNNAEFVNYLASFGGKAIDIDAANKKYNVTINSDAGVAALQFIMDLYKTDGSYPKGIINYDWAEHHSMFIEGKAALAINYAYMYNLASAEGSAVKDVFGATVLPAGPGGTKTAVGGWAVSLAKGSKHKEKAMKLLNWLASAEGTVLWSDFQGAMPTRKSVLEDRIKNSTGLVKGKWEAANQNLLLMVPDTMSQTGESYDALVQIVNSTINAALSTDISAKEAMDSAAEQMKKVLEKNKFMQ